MFVTPKAGTQVPDIDRGGFLSPAGREVDPTPYWNRLVQVGDVVLSTPPIVVPPSGEALQPGDLLIGQRSGVQQLFAPPVSGGAVPAKITGGNQVGNVLTVERAEGWQFTTGQWYLDDVATGSATAGLTLTQLSAAVGKAYGFQPTGIPFRAKAAVTVAAGVVPTAPGQPGAPVATAGDGTVSATWAAAAANGSAVTNHRLRWNGGTPVETGSANLAGSIPAANGVAGTLEVAAFNAIGWGDWSPASNSVTPSAVVVAPTIQSQPAPQAALVGGDALFSVGAQGNPLNYEWQRLIGATWTVVATTAALALTGLTLADNGAQVRVRVWNSANSVLSTAATLTVTAATEQQKLDINGFDVIAQPPLALRQPSVLSISLDAPAAADTAVAVYLRDEDPETATRMRYFTSDAAGTAHYGGYIGPWALYDATANKTFVLYQCLSTATDALGLRVSEFNHASGDWLPSTFVLSGDSSLADDDHGCGTLAIDYQGYLWAVGGSHVTNQYYTSSVNPRDSTSWRARSSLTDGEYGYPNIQAVGNGLWLFQAHQASQRRVNQLRKSTALADGAVTWDAGTDWLDYGADSRVYITKVVQRAGEIFVMCEFRPGDASRIGDQFVYVFNTTTGAVRNVEGTYSTSTFPISLTESRANFRVFDATGQSSGASSLGFDTAGRLHLVYGVAPSQLAGASPIPLYHKMWDGSGWSAQTEVGTVRTSNVTPGLIPNADGSISVSWSFVPSGQSNGYGLMRKRSAAGVWAAAEIFSWGGALLGGPATWYPVLNAHADIRMIASEGSTPRANAWGTPGLGTENSTGGASRLYAYGDQGYMGRLYAEHSAATAAFAAMTVQPSAFRKRLISEHIRSLDQLGIFGQMRAYYCHAAHDAQASRINLRPNRSYDAASTNMKFTLARSVGGTGNTGYLDTGARASFVAMTANTAYLSVYSLTAGPVAGTQLTYPGWTSIELATQNASGNCVATLGGVSTNTNPIDVGHIAVSRYNTTVTTTYVDGVALTNASASADWTAPTSNSVRIQGLRELAWTAIGLGLTRNQVASQKNLEGRFLAEIGAIDPRNAYKKAYLATIPAGQTSVQLGTYTPQMSGAKRVYVENDKALACDQNALATVS